MKKLCLLCLLLAGCGDDAAKLAGANLQKKFDSFLREVNTDREAPESFFTDNGSWDLFKVPLVHPFIIQSTDRKRSGRVFGEGTKFHTTVSVTEFNFDSTHMIYRGESDGEEVWGFVSFSNESQVKFDSIEVMLQEAKMDGYGGSTELIGYEKWFRLFVGGLQENEVNGFSFLEE